VSPVFLVVRCGAGLLASTRILTVGVERVNCRMKEQHLGGRDKFWGVIVCSKILGAVNVPPV